MSKFQGGMIGSAANTPSGTNYTGKANGIWSLPHHIAAKSALQWAIGQTKPNPPTIGSATAASSSSISVAFIPPVQDGGANITSYTVTSTPGGYTGTGSGSPIIVSGLTLGTSYTFTVSATNAIGTSNISGTSNSAIPALTDPYYSSVVLLLNGDTLTDLSNSPKAITNRGSVTVNTSTKKYGTGSMYFSSTSTGAGESMLSTTGLSALNIATGDFTIEMWFYATSLQNYSRLFNINTTWGTDAVCINWNSSGSNMVFSIYNYANPLLSTSSPPSMNTWNHVAVTRSGNTFYLFLNGVQQQTATWSGTMFGTTTPYFTIGNGDVSVGGYSPFTGYIDDLRVTKGVARYTANFTPPTAALLTS